VANGYGLTCSPHPQPLSQWERGDKNDSLSHWERVGVRDKVS